MGGKSYVYLVRHQWAMKGQWFSSLLFAVAATGGLGSEVHTIITRITLFILATEWHTNIILVFAKQT